jgi:hypothetical protein
MLAPAMPHLPVNIATSLTPPDHGQHRFQQLSDVPPPPLYPEYFVKYMDKNCNSVIQAQVAGQLFGMGDSSEFLHPFPKSNVPAQFFGFFHIKNKSPFFSLSLFS